MDSVTPYLIILTVALILNIPFGYIRENYPKFSGMWLFWIHASIPVLVYLRLKLHVSAWLIPLTITFAVFGQIIGSRLRRQRMSEKEREDLEQIPEDLLTQRPAVSTDKLSVLLLNMGGPRTNADVKAFQKLLFEDSRLIRFPLSFLFQKFFAWLLVTLRSHETAKRYQLIGGGSPIYPSTEAQVSALRTELRRRGCDVDVDYSFNYSPPLPVETIRSIKAKRKTHALLLSMYPHYSKATTGSNVHYLKNAAAKIYPELKFITAKPYYLHDGYIRAFADRIREQIKPGEDLNDFYLIFSAHGLPLYFLKEGDVYPYQIAETTARILAELKRNDQWIVSYQSAVGPLQWLKPSTDETIKALARRGIKKLIVVPVSFVGDHIETLCEIDMEYREMAEKLGITDFCMARAIETHSEFIKALADTVEASVKLSNGTEKALSEITTAQRG